MFFFILKHVTLRLWWTDCNRLTKEKKQYQAFTKSVSVHSVKLNVPARNINH